MSLLRDDIDFEGRKARRLFWEMCASREPVHYEDEDDIARWADNMLDEWDKRWVESTKEEGDSK